MDLSKYSDYIEISIPEIRALDEHRISGEKTRQLWPFTRAEELLDRIQAAIKANSSIEVAQSADGTVQETLMALARSHNLLMRMRQQIGTYLELKIADDVEAYLRESTG